MNFSDMIEKMASGQTLTPMEVQSLKLQARRLEESSSLLTSLIKPGTRIISVDGLEAQNARITHGEITDATITNATITDATITNASIASASFSDISVANAQVSINGNGVFFANQEGEVAFESVAGGIEDMSIFSNGADDLVFKNITGISGFKWEVDTSAHEVMEALLKEDPSLAKRLLFLFGDDPTVGKGIKLLLSDSMFMQAHGATGGWAGLGMYATSTPSDAATGHVQVYFKSNKIIFRYDDSGTTRYKYLDLTGTGTTWVHTTSAP